MQPAAAPAPAEPGSARLLEGLAAAITEKGYAATTIADIVRHARVSKRTFYEHFEDKEQCFLASYKTASDRTLEAIAAAVDVDKPWTEQIRAATRAYFRMLEENATLTRTFLLEIHAAGPSALAMRREVHQRFAEMLRGLVSAGRKKNPEIKPLGPAIATALVGGINELVLVALEGGGSLASMEKAAVAFVVAVLAGAREE